MWKQPIQSSNESCRNHKNTLNKKGIEVTLQKLLKLNRNQKLNK